MAFGLFGHVRTNSKPAMARNSAYQVHAGRQKTQDFAAIPALTLCMAVLFVYGTCRYWLLLLPDVGPPQSISPLGGIELTRTIGLVVVAVVAVKFLWHLIDVAPGKSEGAYQ